MKNKSSLLALVAVLVVIGIAIGSRLLVWTSDGHATIGGPFSMTDENGQPVTEKTYAGRWMLIYFGYTYCPDVCPTALGVVAGALDGLSPSERAKLVPIFITVDPERDTPELMKNYTAAFAPDMVGLVGTAEQTNAAKKAFKVYAEKAKGGDAESYTVDHSSILYLMGPDGKFVQHFPHGVTSGELLAGLQKHLH
ncbi:SCO family protein [Magnetospirillum sulfuroxidans]|uniref:SCO family protein n=1 Tax=Magnetospirillum sulfuroxidans TaxID=611300 RepID=A0ABS5IDV2_9PROT|nr:SCO family protein [Magnetospirillum sulfuroxidans]MBR9972595.1 SCO family protein [Magnetospirillum sulfuroxidans]